MLEKYKKQKQTEAIGSSHSLEEVLSNPPLAHDYKNLLFFLERTAESIHKTTVIVQQLESEVARLKYEVMATENEYKNLRHMADDLELNLSKEKVSSELSK
jgi:hypothetical protein